MLDTVIYKGTRFQACGRLDVGVHIKAAHQGASLSHRSGHFPKVHTSWPTSRMQHFGRISTSRKDRRIAQHAFLCKIAADCTEHPMLKYLSLVQSEHSSVHKPFSGKSSWLVLPYHPCWRSAGIAGAVAACNFFLCRRMDRSFSKEERWATLMESSLINFFEQSSYRAGLRAGTLSFVRN